MNQQELENLANNHSVDDNVWSKESFIQGYNKSQETHPNSDEDMIDFADFCENLQKNNKEIRRNNPNITRKELLQLWKQQKS